MTPYRERHQLDHYNATPNEEHPAGEPTLAELREQSKAQGLPTYGTKAELQARLEATTTEE